jgi:hypothetical protein
MLSTAKWSIDDYHRIIEAGILDDRNVELIICLPDNVETQLIASLHDCAMTNNSKFQQI